MYTARTIAITTDSEGVLVTIVRCFGRSPGSKVTDRCYQDITFASSNRIEDVLKKADHLTTMIFPLGISVLGVYLVDEELT